MSLPPNKNHQKAEIALEQPATTSKVVYNRLVGFAFVLDTFVIVLALAGAHWLRFSTSMTAIGSGIPVYSISFSDYTGHFCIGAALMVMLLINYRFYTRECLLSYPATLKTIVKSAVTWVFAFFAITMVLKFDPPVSRLYSVFGMILMILGMSLTRGLLWGLISNRKFSASLRQRALVVGWGEEFDKAIKTFKAAPERHFDIVGVIAPPGGEFASPVPNFMPVMGRFEDIQLLLQMKICQMVIVADDLLENEELFKIASICEKELIEFKLIPTCFRVLRTGLHLESIGDIPVMGISKLPLHSTLNQYIKRMIDIIGAIVGLILSLPIMAVLGVLIYRESPGPVFYRQKRLGANGRLFDMIKLRSMKLDAEANGQIWTVENDPRRLRIGTFMREWSLDEVPQFWNVLVGDISLVGPRPERPESIDQFKEYIPHYNARHNIKPGITGWAQVNGLRGDTDISERIRYDLHYIENWSLAFDFQIMLLTFFHREGAY